MKANRLSILLILVLCAGYAAAQARFFDDPYVWDGLYYAAASARDLYLHPGKLIPNGPWDNGHPALLFWLLAAGWLLAGPHLWVSHLIMLSFGLATLFLTWKAGTSLFGARAGLLGALLLAVHPLLFYQTGTLSLDVPVAALGLCVFLAARRGKFAAAAIAGCAMVLTRESALVFLPGLVAAALLTSEPRQSLRSGVKGALLAMGLPTICLAAWFVAHHQVVGWWLYSDRSREVKLGLSDLFGSLPYELYRRTLRPFIRDHGQWAATAIIAAVLGWELLRRRKVKPTREAWVLAGTCAALVLPIGAIITMMSFYLPRYIVPALPFYCLLAGWAAARTGRAGPFLAGAVMVPLILAHQGRPRIGWESNEGHLRAMEMNLKASRYLEKHYPNARILARWPIWQQLCDPIYGYVDKAMSVVVVGNNSAFAGYCAPGRYVYIPGLLRDRVDADDFDLIWVSPDDAAKRRYKWLEDRLDLKVADSVDYEGLRVFFYAPVRRGG